MASITDTERASQPGILDSDLLGEGKPLSAKALREIVRTANFMRDAGATMLMASFPPTPSGEEALLASPDAKLLYTWRVPSRPVHTRAEVRIRANIESGGALRFFVSAGWVPYNPDPGFTAVGTGSVLVYTTTIPLRGAEYQNIRLSAQAATGVAASAVGTPTSWNSGVQSTGVLYDHITNVAASWVDAELSSGDYTLTAKDPTSGADLVRKRIAAGRSGVQIYTTEPFTAAERAALLSGPVDYEITRSVSFSIRSLIIRGVPS